MLRHQLPSLCSLFISIILKNERADIQNTAMSWWLLNQVPKYLYVPMSNRYSSTFLSQIPKADVSHAKVMLWLSTFAYNRSSDPLLLQNMCAFVFSDSPYSASTYKKLLNPGANFRTVFHCRIICNLS